MDSNEQSEAEEIIGSLECEDCHCQDSTVTETTCPYQEEVNGITENVTLCSSCYNNRAANI